MMYCNKPSEQARVIDGKETSRWLSCGSEKDQKVRQRTGSARESPEASEYFAYEKVTCYLSIHIHPLSANTAPTAGNP